MRSFAALVALIACAAAGAAHAGERASDRFVSGVPLEIMAGIATYGPFRVVDGSRAALVGITDEHSPAQFAALLRDYPQLARLDLVECPGTFDDQANLSLGRMIRAAGISTHVPADGSVRSGAVELLFAGTSQSVEDGARFAVHAWMDEDGMEADDYALAAPENRKYLAYYRDMGMDEGEAAAFYAMTNSVPHDQALWLSAEEMRRWVHAAGDHQQAAAVPQIAYSAVLDLDLGLALN